MWCALELSHDISGANPGAPGAVYVCGSDRAAGERRLKWQYKAGEWFMAEQQRK